MVLLYLCLGKRQRGSSNWSDRYLPAMTPCSVLGRYRCSLHRWGWSAGSPYIGLGGHKQPEQKY